VIHDFKDPEAAKIFNRERSNRLPVEIQKAAWRKLSMIEYATRLDDLRVPPGNRLEKLSGERAGTYSIRINEQWRICFDWRDGAAWQVEIVDYH
jgi:proteic killer suppression protein